MPAESSVAKLQKQLLLGIVACASTWLLLVWSHSPLAAVIGAIAIAFGHGLLLFIEFVWMLAVNRRDPTPPPSAWQALAAWFGEVVQDVVVFAWRQPFTWQRIPDDLSPARGGERGVVFVHGFFCNRAFWTPWLHRAKANGHPFIAVNLEPTFGSIEDYVDAIEQAVAQITEATGRPPVLVCHSMGGLAARAWLRAQRQTSRIAHIVTIGSPHGGTSLARFSRARNTRQMRIGNEWLRALDADDQGFRQVFTCWYSNCDNVVFPASTATLAGADNRFVRGSAHVQLAFRRNLMDETFALVRAL